MFSLIFEDGAIDQNNFNLVFEDNSIPKIVYHYTSLCTLYAILNTIREEKNKDSKYNSLILRGTHIDHLNDFTEFKETTELMAKLMIKYEKTLCKKQNKNIAEKFYSDYWKNFITLNGLHTLPFVTSFSENFDSLPMWNTYGEKGKGVAIGIEIFDTKRIGFQFNSDIPVWRKCIYDSKPLSDILYEVIKNEFYNAIEFKDGNILIHGLLNFPNIMSYFSILKHFAFSYEQEWRLIKSYSSSDQIIKSNEINKPYVEFKLPQSVLKEIYIGPCPEEGKEATLKSVKKQLKSAGYCIDESDKHKEILVKVDCSKIPFRLI